MRKKVISRKPIWYVDNKTYELRQGEKVKIRETEYYEERRNDVGLLFDYPVFDTPEDATAYLHTTRTARIEYLKSEKGYYVRRIEQMQKQIEECDELLRNMEASEESKE